MATSISAREPQVIDGISTVAGESVRATVTGLDENGQMFREAAPILNLNGRGCSFRSKFQPAVGSWMLIEIDLLKQGSKRSTLQGQVKSVQAEGLATNLFQVSVELESAQEVRPEVRPEVRIDASPQGTQAPAPESLSGAASAARNKSDVPEKSLRAAAADASDLGARVATEVKQQLAAWKASFGQELESIVQRTASSRVEQMVRQAIEQQISVSYRSAMETLNSDLMFQLVGRLAGSEELHGCIEKMAKEILATQMEVSRNSAVEAQHNLNAQVTEITGMFEKSVADMEGRLKVARESVAAILDQVQALEHKAADQTLNLRETVAQLNQTARSTIEKFDGRVTAQLNSWSLQFKTHLGDVSREKSAQFATDLQQQLAAPMQDATEVLEKLSAGLQLAQGTLRMQQEHLAGLSRAAAADFEKEVKGVLLRLSGNV